MNNKYSTYRPTRYACTVHPAVRWTVLRLAWYIRPIRFENSIRNRIGRPIRFDIRFERKKTIRRSLLIVVWSDFRQDIIDTAIDQCRKHLQACVRANGGHLNTFCEQTLAKNLHFSCVFRSSSFCPSCQIFTASCQTFTVLMLDGQ